MSVFNVDIAFVGHFTAPHPPDRSACSIGYASKKLFKMAGNSVTIQSTADAYVDKTMNSNRIVVNYMHVRIYFPSLDTILQIIKISIFKNYGSHVGFLKSSHIYS